VIYLTHAAARTHHAPLRSLQSKRPFAEIARLAKRLQVFDDGFATQSDRRDVIGVKNDVLVSCGAATTGNTLETVPLKDSKPQSRSDLTIVFLGALPQDSFPGIWRPLFRFNRFRWILLVLEFAHSTNARRALRQVPHRPSYALPLTVDGGSNISLYAGGRP